MATRYLVFEGTATEPEALQDWLNEQAADGWRMVSIVPIPAGSVKARFEKWTSGGKRMNVRGFRTGGWGSHAFAASVVTNLWITLERTD